MLTDAYVTGMGVISAIGRSVGENLHALLHKQSGITAVAAGPGKEAVMAGRVAFDDATLARDLGFSRLPVSRTSLLGMTAALEAWGDNRHIPGLKTGLIASTSVGGMDKSEVFYDDFLAGRPADYGVLVCHDSGTTSETIAEFLGISGYVNTISTACSSGANAIMLGARLLRSGRLDRVLVGGSDALTRFTINGFESLMIYDSEWTRPFDEARKGLNLGEGAAFLLMESEKSFQVTGNRPLGRVRGWGNAADAYHQTASSPEGKGATLAIAEAIRTAGLTPADISYVNAHGTGTPNNDLSESVALKNVFGASVPFFSSTKAFTGHTLAAAGAIEAVYSLLAIKEGMIWPNLNFAEAIRDTGLVPVTEPGKCTVDAVLSNSFGFGGNNSSLVFTL
ncbi:MAG: beta-ACP synthase [Cytophagaceae bacterium SCN 52-12]|nr:MAG: beta-ACP synthase [Cytophagaceae bacterium SCN 52-12]